MWDEVFLGHVLTSYVRIEVVTVYTTNSNGFGEVEFYIGSSKFYISVFEQYRIVGIDNVIIHRTAYIVTFIIIFC